MNLFKLFIVLMGILGCAIILGLYIVVLSGGQILDPKNDTTVIVVVVSLAISLFGYMIWLYRKARGNNKKLK